MADYDLMETTTTSADGKHDMAFPWATAYQPQGPHAGRSSISANAGDPCIRDMAHLDVQVNNSQTLHVDQTFGKLPCNLPDHHLVES